jgi:hypothetical protein
MGLSPFLLFPFFRRPCLWSHRNRIDLSPFSLGLARKIGPVPFCLAFSAFLCVFPLQALRRLLSQAPNEITITATKTIKGRSSEFVGFSFFCY